LHATPAFHRNFKVLISRLQSRAIDAADARAAIGPSDQAADRTEKFIGQFWARRQTLGTGKPPC
jgi:hypothetical protein